MSKHNTQIINITYNGRTALRPMVRQYSKFLFYEFCERFERACDAKYFV